MMYMTFDPDLAPQAAAVFSGMLLPRVSASPGFVAGYWVDPVEAKGFGFVVFETEHQARSATIPALWTAPGVVLEQTEIRRIAARA
jgi:hypothetical protein